MYVQDGWRWVVGGMGLVVGLLAVPAAGQPPIWFDNTFGGGDGVRLMMPTLAGTLVHVNDVAVAFDEQIWVAGSVLVSGDFDMFACRMNTTGTAHSCLVLPFDLGGALTDLGSAIAVDVAGRAVMVGSVSGPAGDTEARVAALRLTSAMALDSSFGGGDGRVDLALSGAVDIRDVKLMTDGRIVFVGSIDQTGSGGSVDILVGRLTSTGAWDTSFDGDGRRIVSLDLGGSNADRGVGLALTSDGAVVVAATVTSGSTSSEIWAVQLTSSGGLDASFNGSGLAEVVLSGSAPRSAVGVALDRQGRIVVSGKDQGLLAPDKVVVGRFLPSGGPDLSFGIAGVARHEIGHDAITGVVGPVMAPGPADAAVVVGRYLTGVPADATDTYTLRVDKDGDADAIWGMGSGVETQNAIPSVADPASFYSAAAFQQGRLIVVGAAEGTGSAFVARMRVDTLFCDDFESGGTNAWSVVVGDGGPGG